MLMIDVVISEREQQKNTAAQQQLHFGMPEVEAVCPEHCLWLGEEVSAVANLLAKKCRLRRLAECLNWRKHLFFVRFRLQQLPLPLSQIADRGNCTITSADYLKHGCFRHQQSTIASLAEFSWLSLGRSPWGALHHKHRSCQPLFCGIRCPFCCGALQAAVHVSFCILILTSLLQTHYAARQLLNLFSLVALTPRRSSTEFSSTASGSMTARYMP